MMYEIVSHPIDAAAVTAAVAHAAAGATVTFIGTTRDHNEGRRVTRLEYEAYPEMATRKMREIVDEMRVNWGVSRVAMVHRTGVLAIGEASVGIVVSSPHRREAFAACQHAIDRMKQTVPIWKKEIWSDGERWIGWEGASTAGCAETTSASAVSSP
jgi:molybdopterin synthase catalytic subunit